MNKSHFFIGKNTVMSFNKKMKNYLFKKQWLIVFKINKFKYLNFLKL